MTSMAFSDAIIGSFSMPLGIYELFQNGHWYLGETVCSVRNTFDVFLCTVSIYHVVCMAVDRYLAVCKPFVYRKLTTRASYYMIASSWTIPSGLIIVPIITQWDSVGVKDIVICFQLANYCNIIFNLPFQIASIAVSFYIPITIIYVLYYLIARQIWKVYKRAPKLYKYFVSFKKPRFQKSNCGLPCELGGQRAVKKLDGNERNDELSEVEMAMNDKETCTMLQLSRTAVSVVDSHAEISCGPNDNDRLKTIKDVDFKDGRTMQHKNFRHLTSAVDQSLRPETIQLLDKESGVADFYNGTSSVPLSSFPSTVMSTFVQTHTQPHTQAASKSIETSVHEADRSVAHSPAEHDVKPAKLEKSDASFKQGNLCSTSRKKKASRGLRNKKAVITIGSIVVCFTICWMPFSIYIVILSYYSYNLPFWAGLLVTWLGYVNSAMNPVLYCCNRSIREEVRSFLFPNKSHGR